GDSSAPQPHQHPGECAAEVEAAVEKNQRKAEKAEPEMAAHPGLRAAEAPDGDAFAGAQCGGEEHEGESKNAEEQANGAAATRALRGVEGVGDVDRDGERGDDCGGQGPGAMGAVYAHRVSFFEGRRASRMSRRA